MSIYKRKSGHYSFNFWLNGRHVQRSTKTKNPKLARRLEAECRLVLWRGEEWPPKPPEEKPTLKDFCKDRVAPWAEATFEKSSPKTFLWYRTGMRWLEAFAGIADKRLDAVTTETIADYTAHLQAKQFRVASVNAALQVLRRCLHLAVEWGLLDSALKVKMQRGAARRERVITPLEEAKFLNAAPEPLASIAAVLLDSGMRPEECFRLRWEAVARVNGRHGVLQVTHGKTASARRVLPLTPRVRHILEARWENAGKPEEGWVWPAPTKAGHIEPSSLKKMHAATFKTLAKKAAENNEKAVQPFVLYSLRHTFLTRLGESGCDSWTLARIAGHSSIQVSARYCHPSDNAVQAAMRRFETASPAAALPS